MFNEKYQSYIYVVVVWFPVRECANACYDCAEACRNIGKSY